MIFKSDYDFNRADTKDENGNAREDGEKRSKVGELYVSVTCFAANCLSSIALEAGSRSPLGSSVTKSVAFNTIFRRNYNLKIKILVTNVITGLITTITMTLGNKYGVPYLYLPWLVNTINGLALCEGPALFNLARILLPNATFPIVTFLLMSLLLYVEELCIWSDVFTSFQRCWMGYHCRKKYVAQRVDEEPIDPRGEKLPCREPAEKDVDVTVEKFADGKKLIDLSDKFDSEVSVDSALKLAKGIAEDEKSSIRNRFADVTG